MAEPETKFYERLAAQFDKHQPVNGFQTISAEQVVSRLNEVLGYEGWSFFVKEHGIHQEADEIWALGRLEVYRGDGITIVREQFGSQKIKRFNPKRQDGTPNPNAGKPIDLGHDLMGAATTAMKKCATWIGVGLYLSSKGNSTGASRGNQGNQSRPAANAGNGAPSNSSRQATGSTGGPIPCSDCGAPLEPFPVRYGPSEQYPKGREVTWDVQTLAQNSKRKHGRVLCGDHYFAPSP